MQSEPVRLTVLRAAVDARDARSPGFRAAVEAIAVASDDTHYTVPRDAYRSLSGVRRVAAARRKRFALGDAVERTLSAVGITKDLVQRITRKPCGCPARQRWLNQWGYRQQERIERAVNKAARWYGIT